MDKVYSDAINASKNQNKDPIGILEISSNPKHVLDLNEITLSDFNKLKRGKVASLFETCNTSFFDDQLKLQKDSTIILVTLTNKPPVESTNDSNGEAKDTPMNREEIVDLVRSTVKDEIQDSLDKFSVAIISELKSYIDLKLEEQDKKIDEKLVEQEKRFDEKLDARLAEQEKKFDKKLEDLKNEILEVMNKRFDEVILAIRELQQIHIGYGEEIKYKL